MKYLITSALPYINGVKHLGNLVGSMLPADVTARFLRQEGEEVLYICATDEHGTPAEIGAFHAKQSVEKYCTDHYELQKNIYERFGLSFDYFGRSSSEENKKLTQHFYKELKANNLITKKTIKSFYSVDDQRYLPDRYVTGTCPHCGYEKARGDQCENCSKLLDPTDLIEAKSTISGGSNIEIRETEHLFLKLDLMTDKVKKWLRQDKENWPKIVSSIAQKWLTEGLRERCITRDLSWGVPIPEPGFETKVFYVWFDAPFEYIGATQEWANSIGQPDEWKKWWKDPENVKYFQYMAKDNIPFHTIMWPSVLLGTDEKIKMVDFIKGMSWLTYYGGKFSTSEKRGVFTDQALEVFPADYWRWALMAMIPESDDSSFTWNLFQDIVNADLANNFGNFVNRTLKFTASKIGETVPEGGEWTEREEKLQTDVNKILADISSYIHQQEFRKAISSMRELWSLGNHYIDEQAPWKLLKTDPQKCHMVIRTCINLIRVNAIAAFPFIPFTSELIFEHLELAKTNRQFCLTDGLDLKSIPAGQAFKIPPILFQRLDDEKITNLKDKFQGKEG
ncbi:methionine--tRNA ligase [bacterium]|nr:methionine--tRNA ligase [bacterium]